MVITLILVQFNIFKYVMLDYAYNIVHIIYKI